MTEKITPEEMADRDHDRYVAEHGPIVTSPAFTELAARTLLAAAKRQAAEPADSGIESP